MRYCKNCGKEIEASHHRRIWCDVNCAASFKYKKKMYDYKFRMAKILGSAKHRAKIKKLPFDLDHEFLVELWENQNGACALTAIPFYLGPPPEEGHTPAYTPSIDRIVPKLGYTKSNVRLICYHMNIALSDFGDEGFEKLAKAYFKNLGGIK